MNPYVRTRGIDREHRLTQKCWYAMMQRCYRETHPGYKNYGGRGITVCSEWHTFEGFQRDMGYKPEGLSLDRVNNDGNYEPSNCRWATASEQQRNKRPYRFKHIANAYGTFAVKTGDKL